MTVTDKDSALSICEKIKIEYVLANPADIGLNKIESTNNK